MIPEDPTVEDIAEILENVVDRARMHKWIKAHALDSEPLRLAAIWIVSEEMRELLRELAQVDVKLKAQAAQPKKPGLLQPPAIERETPPWLRRRKRKW
jgi:hypothetical protein